MLLHLYVLTVTMLLHICGYSILLLLNPPYPPAKIQKILTWDFRITSFIVDQLLL